MANFTWQRTIVDDAGDIIPDAEVTVRDTDDALVDIFDIDDVALDNPFTATSQGFAQFRVPVGEYNITATGGGSSLEWEKEYIGDTGATQKDVKAPTFLSPTSGDTDVLNVLTVEGSPYNPLYSENARDTRRIQIITSGGDFSSPDIEVAQDSDNIAVGVLTPGTTYEARMRDEPTTGTNIDWSSVISFTTVDAIVTKPSNSAPAGSATGVAIVPTLTSSAFAVTGSTDTHVASQWRVFQGATEVYNSGEVTDLESHTLTEALSGSTEYLWNVRHKGDALGWSEWSSLTSFTTTAEFVSTPTLTVEGASSSVPENPTLTGDAFAVASGSDTHASTDWQVLDSSGSLVWESLADASNLTTINVPIGNLYPHNSYTFRVRYNGTSFGASAWDEVEADTLGGMIDLLSDQTPQLSGPLDANGHIVQLSKGSDIASSGSVPNLTIPSDGNYFDVTGTDDITQISAVDVGTTVRLHFDDSLVLVHDGDDITIPGGQDLLLEAGDEVTITEHASGKWRVTGVLSKSVLRGGGFPQFIAATDITEGEAVALDFNNEIEAVEVTGSTEVEDTSPFGEGNQIANLRSCYDSNRDRIVVAYRDIDDGNKLKAATGVINPTTKNVTYRPAVAATTGSATPAAIAFDSTANKFVIFYRDNASAGSEGMAVVGEVDTNGDITYGTPVEFSSNEIDGSYGGAAFDPVEGVIVLGYHDDDASVTRVIAGQVSGTSITFSTPDTAPNNSRVASAVYDPDSGNTAMVSGFADEAFMVDVTGTTITTVGAAASFTASSTIRYPSIGYDETNNKLVVAFRDSTFNEARAALGTVSGTTITFGTDSQFLGRDIDATGISYDEVAGGCVIAYQDSSGDQPYVVGVDASGATPSFTALYQLQSFAMQSGSTHIPITYDPIENRHLIVYVGTSTGSSAVFYYDPAAPNADDFIGFAQSAVSTGDPVSVAVKYAVDENQSGLTKGTQYWIEDDGSLSSSDTGYPIAGTAITPTKIQVGV